jgi:hypothetical protein
VATTATARTATAQSTASLLTHPAPRLLAPREEDAGSLLGTVTFRWQHSRPLAGDEYFQVLIWREGQPEPHLGASELTRQFQQDIDLDEILAGRGGPGQYRWCVVVVRKTAGGGEQRLSPEDQGWAFTFVGSPEPTGRAPTATRQPVVTAQPPLTPQP